MNVISIPVAVMVGITLYVGLNHLIIFLKRKTLKDLTFALNCVTMAIYQIFCIGVYNSQSVAGSVFWQRGQAIGICLVGTLFPWFIHHFFSLKTGKLTYLYSGFFIVSAIIQVIDRSNLTWIPELPSIKHITLPFDISITYNEASTGIATMVLYLIGITMFLYVLWIAAVHYRKTRDKKAILLIISVIVYFIGAINDMLISMGVLNSIYIIEYTYLGFVILMAGSFNTDLIEAVKIRKSSEESEESFRKIVELTPYPIFIIGADERLEYVNPRFTEVFGYRLEDIPSVTDWFRVSFPDMEARQAAREAWDATGEPAHDGLSQNGKKEFLVASRKGALRCVIFRFLTIFSDKHFVIFDDITEQRETERSLREREERYRLIYENALEVIFSVDRDFIITYISPYSERILGYTPNELIGRSLLGINLLARESLELARSNTMRTLGGETIASSLYKFVTKDGNIRHAEVSGSPLVRNGEIIGMVGFAHDITDKKIAEDTIIKRDRILNAVSKAANVLLRSRNLDNAVNDVLGMLGRATQMNRITVFKNIAGEEGEIIMMKRFAWRLEDSNDDEIQDLDGITYEAIPRWKEKISREEVIYGLTEDFPGKERSILSRRGVLSTVIVPIFVSERWWGFIKFDDCKTKRIWNPVEIEVLKSAASIIGSTLERTRSEEEMVKTSKIESLGVFAGGIAHDFNNLLTAVIGNISLAKQSLPPGSEVRSILTEAEEASQRTKELTLQLLTFSKGGMPIRKASSIRNLLIDTAQFVLSGTNYQKEYNIQEGLWNAHIDSGQISQVIHNILLNARQAMKEKGAITLSAENLVIDEQSKLPLKPGKYIRIRIRDQGEGISKKNLRNIFDPYFSTKKDGSGLGLSISYSIIKKHDGDITVQSEIGRGSNFDIYLPATDDTVEPGDTESHIPHVTGGRALVMDDDATVLRVAERMLSRLGFSVVRVSDGVEAIKAYEESVRDGRPYDIVIMDLTIPGGMGGREANGILQQKYPGARVIVSSGYSNDPIMADYITHGFKGVIVKPYKFEELSETVYRVMKV